MALRKRVVFGVGGVLGAAIVVLGDPQKHSEDSDRYREHRNRSHPIALDASHGDEPRQANKRVPEKLRERLGAARQQSRRSTAESVQYWSPAIVSAPFGVVLFALASKNSIAAPGAVSAVAGGLFLDFAPAYAPPLTWYVGWAGATKRLAPNGGGHLGDDAGTSERAPRDVTLAADGRPMSYALVLACVGALGGGVGVGVPLRRVAMTAMLVRIAATIRW
jgi:hypothetical protein